MQRVGDRVEDIVRIEKHGRKFDKLVLAVIGDINDGTEIYRTQSHHQAISNVEQQADEVARHVLGPFIRRMAKLFPRVEVHCVPGNHGRAGWTANEAASWDVVAYRYTSAEVRNLKNVTFEIEPIVENIKVVDVRGHGYLLYHGHGIKSFGNIPFYGMMKRLLMWTSTKTIPRFDVALMGHFHSGGKWTINSFDLMMNGTMVTDDEWALQELGWESANRWWFFGISNSRPITFSYEIDTT